MTALALFVVTMDSCIGHAQVPQGLHQVAVFVVSNAMCVCETVCARTATDKHKASSNGVKILFMRLFFVFVSICAAMIKIKGRMFKFISGRYKSFQLIAKRGDLEAEYPCVDF